MIILYKDPEGQSVFERRPSAVTSTATGEKAIMIQARVDLENEVAALKKVLKEREDTIARMKQDMADKDCEVRNLDY